MITSLKRHSDTKTHAVDRNIDLMAAVDTAAAGGWCPLWTWSRQRGLVSFHYLMASTLNPGRHEVLFRDGVVMPAAPRDNHRGALIGWGHKDGATLGTSCARQDKPVAFRKITSESTGRE